MRPSAFLFASVSITLFASFIAGCNGNHPFPVDGTVKIKGGGDVSRLKGYIITCELMEPGPDGQKPSATGEIDANGRFELSTNATNDGAYPGKYRVALTPPLPFGDTPPTPPVLAAKYKDLRTSDLTMTVEAKRTPVTLDVDPVGN